jgi:hypothetical protein
VQAWLSQVHGGKLHTWLLQSLLQQSPLALHAVPNLKQPPSPVKMPPSPGRLPSPPPLLEPEPSPG